MENQRVLKAHSLRELGQKVVFDFEDFHKHCDDQLAEARLKAEHFFHQTQSEAGVLRENSRNQGYQAGYATGMQKAAQEIEAKADAKAKVQIDLGLAAAKRAVETLARQVADAKLEWLTRWETTAIELSVAIAEKIICAELARRPDLGQSMVRELLDLATSEPRVTARVHPEDAEVLRESVHSSGELPRMRQMVEFQPDPQLSRGECIVQLEHGEIDGRVATQLARLATELCPQEEQIGENG